jgi:diamine N-acetyltransferase
VIIRRARADDAAPLAALAERTFRETFAGDNRPEDMDVFTRSVYGEDKQRRELEDPAMVTLLAESDGEPIAFSQLKRVAEGMEILRFYVDARWHGHGAAQELMRATEDAARELGATTIRLGVWERNARAIAFYAKCGYRDVGAQPFLLGSDLQTDRVMVKELSSPDTSNTRTG